MVPGIRCDSSEVTVCELHLSEAAMQGSILLLPLFHFTYLFLSLCSPLKPYHRAAYAAALGRQGVAGKSKWGTGAASDGSMGIGNTWRSAAQEVPPVTEALAKHRSKFEFSAKQRDPFRGKLLKSKWRGEHFTAEHGAPASELNCSEEITCPVTAGFGPPFSPCPTSCSHLLYCGLDGRVDRKRSEFITASQFIKPAG